MPVEVVARAEYFPTLFPQRGGFLVGDVNAVLGYLDNRGFQRITPNEVFVTMEDGADRAMEQGLREVFPLFHLNSRSALEEEALVDPLAVAGWRGTGLVAVSVTIIAAVLGYVTYFAAYAGRMRVESALIRALGLSRSHFLRMLLVEHVLVAVTGAAIGVAAGLFVSRLAANSMTVNEAGGLFVPPFTLRTEWLSTSLLLAFIAASVSLAVLVLVRCYDRAPLHELTRVEE